MDIRETYRRNRRVGAALRKSDASHDFGNYGMTEIEIAAYLRQKRLVKAA
jgi:hypothetical protein